MRLIDRQFLETPFYGVRQMTWHLRNEGHGVNQKRIRRLIRLMGLMPIHQIPNISKPAKGHKTYPYLLGALRLDSPIRSRAPTSPICLCGAGSSIWWPSWTGLPAKFLSWRISNTLEVDFCIEALSEAVNRFGPPEIMNTDQGSHFTSFAWTDRLKRVGTRISMDGKGRCIDNIFIERLWRSLKYECVYLHAWETGSQSKAGVAKWISFYNRQRPHTAHGGQPPAVVYFTQTETDQQRQRAA